MRLESLTVASALLALSFAPPPATEGRPDPEPPLSPTEKRFQGDWIGFEPDREESRWTLHFEGRSFRTVGPHGWHRGRIELRDGDPAAMDLLIDDCECNFKGQTSEAIFRWDEDSIILDGAIPGDARPVEFGTQPVQQLRLVRAKDN